MVAENGTNTLAQIELVEEKTMTQDERWLVRYKEVMGFLEENHRNPSRHRIEEHNMLSQIKQQRKLIKAETFKSDRMKKFEKLQELMEEYKRKNQYDSVSWQCKLNCVKAIFPYYINQMSLLLSQHTVSEQFQASCHYEDSLIHRILHSSKHTSHPLELHSIYAPSLVPMHHLFQTVPVLNCSTANM